MMKSFIELDDLTPIGPGLDLEEIAYPDEKPGAVMPEFGRRLSHILKEAGDEQVNAKAVELAALTRAELDKRSMLNRVRIKSNIEREASLPDRERLEFWLLNREYTRRNIPPVLRDLYDPSDDDPDQIADIFAVDLEWLVHKYPRHTTMFERWKNIFVQSRLVQTAEWISRSYPRKAMHWFCKGLHLFDDQQREMHILKRDGIRKEFERVKASKEEARVKLSGDYHHRAKDVRYRTENYRITINRRANVWFAGSVVGWDKPQRIAEFFEAMTGEKITRQLAAKIVSQVHRAIPESKPKPKRNRKKIEVLPILTI